MSLRNLQQVFQRLREAKLKLNSKKCNLFRRRLNYLGHAVSEEEVSTDPGRIGAIKIWAVLRIACCAEFVLNTTQWLMFKSLFFSIITDVGFSPLLDSVSFK